MNDFIEMEKKQDQKGKVIFQIHDQKFNPRMSNAEFLNRNRGKRLKVIGGSQWDDQRKHVWVQDETGQRELVNLWFDGEIVEGKKKDIYWRPGVYMGNTSLMGRIGRAIRSGRTARGR